MRTELAASTVITIAHRIVTIIDSDKILVMDKGRAVEYDHASNLLSNPEGLFYSIVTALGDQAAETLKAKAFQKLDPSTALEQA